KTAILSCRDQPSSRPNRARLGSFSAQGLPSLEERVSGSRPFYFQLFDFLSLYGRRKRRSGSSQNALVLRSVICSPVRPPLLGHPPFSAWPARPRLCPRPGIPTSCR